MPAATSRTLSEARQWLREHLPLPRARDPKTAWMFPGGHMGGGPVLPTVLDLLTEQLSRPAHLLTEQLSRPTHLLTEQLSRPTHLLTEQMSRPTHLLAEQPS
ncbi:hypothetical protein HOK021_38750 [Streptomyces hygroscopicus]|nr:hypothetical protein HOK021_38750 [Streptomyces hygroscopicus]